MSSIFCLFLFLDDECFLICMFQRYFLSGGLVLPQQVVCCQAPDSRCRGNAGKQRKEKKLGQHQETSSWEAKSVPFSWAIFVFFKRSSWIVFKTEKFMFSFSVRGKLTTLESVHRVCYY